MPKARGLEVDATSSTTIIFLWRNVWRYRLAIGLFTLVLVVVALLVGLLSRPIYRAEVTAFPVQNSMPLGGKLGALAANFGLGGAGGADSQLSVTPPIQETLALLQSRRLTLQFLYSHNSLPELFPGRWDADHRQWKPPTLFERAIAWLSGHPPQTEPTADQAFEKFDSIRTVSMDPISGIVTVSIEWQDPEVAADWANGLVQTTDNALRNETRIGSEKSLAYLEKAAAQASLADLRSSIYDVANKEIAKGMIASAQDHFAIQIIDPATPPTRKAWPKTGFLIAISTVAGLFLGAIGAILWAQLIELRKIMVQSSTSVSGTGRDRTHAAPAKDVSSDRRRGDLDVSEQR